MGNSSSSSSEYSSSTTGWDITKDVDLKDKICLVTGGNSGIGAELCRVLAKRGASVIIGARNEKTGAERVDAIVRETANEQVFFLPLDLSAVKSVVGFVGSVRALFSGDEPKLQGPSRVDWLFLNAGVYGIPKTVTEDTGLEKTFAINHFGHFALARLLLPELGRAAGGARVIVTSSASHNAPTSFDLDEIKTAYGDHYEDKFRMPVYGMSKLCNVYFAREFTKRHPDIGVAYSFHPGVVNTQISRGSTIASLFVGMASRLSPGGRAPQQAIATPLRCALDKTLDEEHKGAYFEDCQPYKTSELAKNDTHAAALWDWSVELYNKHVAPLVQGADEHKE